MDEFEILDWVIDRQTLEIPGNHAKSHELSDRLTLNCTALHRLPSQARSSL
jgi:hypothetical protein